MIDFHCHLDLYPNPAAIVDDCKRRGLYVLSVTTTPSAWRGTSALANNAHRIQTALGLHPQLAHERSAELPLFDEILPQVRYVGEVGLDGAPEYRQHWHTQVIVFEHILAKCSAAGGRIMTIHSRRASSAVLDRIQKFPEAGTFVLHWFSGSARDLDRAIKLGCWFSVGPVMLTGHKGRSLVARMPRERVLTETDGPFTKLDGCCAQPWQVQLALDELSTLWCLSHEAVKRLLLANLRNLLVDLDST